MTKIMLVEDDKSLREIYGVRLLAEGYDIVSAGDGEEALAMAIKERPQLIISDVMMPKVSGYDMLDILRSTTETKNIRVIMMTALSSEEQRARAESLGADRYLVKSQVGIEDVVRVVHEVLEDTPQTMAATAAPRPITNPAPQGPAPLSAPTPSSAPVPQAAIPVATPQPAIPTMTVAPTQIPVTQPQPQAPAAAPMPQPQAVPVTTTPIPVTASTPLPQPGAVIPVATPVPMPGGPAPAAAMPRPMGVGGTPKPASLKTRIIQPLGDPTVATVNINDLLDKELAKEAGIADNERPVVATLDQERAELDAELKAFTPPAPTPVMAPPAQEITPMPVVPPVLPTPGVATTGQPAMMPQPAVPLETPAATAITPGPSPVQQLPQVPKV